MVPRWVGRIDYHPFKAWINAFLARPSGGEARPVFWEIDKACRELGVLEEAYPNIRREVDTLLSEHASFPAYHEINSPAAEISLTTEGRWSVYMLELLGHRVDEHLARCPETARALAKIPCRIQAFFSILEPGKTVPLHRGPYLGYLRYHLGVRVPQDHPPVLRVAGQPYTWKEGEGMVFDDSWPHEVENHSGSPRVVLIVDVLRPLPRVHDWINRAFLYGLAAPLYGKRVIEKVKMIGQSPGKDEAPSIEVGARD